MKCLDNQSPQEVGRVSVIKEEDILVGEEVGGVTDIYLTMSKDLKYVEPLTGERLRPSGRFCRY